MNGPACIKFNRQPLATLLRVAGRNLAVPVEWVEAALGVRAHFHEQIGVAMICEQLETRIVVCEGGKIIVTLDGSGDRGWFTPPWYATQYARNPGVFTVYKRARRRKKRQGAGSFFPLLKGATGERNSAPSNPKGVVRGSILRRATLLS